MEWLVIVCLIWTAGAIYIAPEVFEEDERNYPPDEHTVLGAMAAALAVLIWPAVAVASSVCLAYAYWKGEKEDHEAT